MSFDSLEYKTTSESAESVKAGAINLDEAQGIVECFVSGIGNKDSVGDIVASGAFTKSLMRRKPRVVWGHNWNDPIGKVLEIYEVGANDRRLPLKMKMAGIGGLFAKVQFNLHSEKGREAFANVAFFGEEQEWSIGYKTLRAQYDQKSQANIIYELELYEVSPVLHGANQLTGTISVKADDPYAMDPMYGPATTTMKPKPEPQSDMMTMVKMMESQLSEMLGGKVSIVEMDDQNVTYAKPGMNGTMQKFRCPYMRDGERFMFGVPKPIAMPMMPMAAPMPGAPAMPSAPMPPNDPRRIVRPQQMPGMPVAIKPGANGMMMVPLPPVQYENQEPLPEADKNNLDKEEADLRDALLKIVKRHGRFNEDREGVWAGYKPAAENYIAKIGVKCANCVFYKGGSNCEIIAMPVEPEGKCRFAVIPKGVVNVDMVGKKQYEAEYDAEQDKYVDELEEKYPGELAVAALRGVIKRGKKKRRKYALLSDFGSKDDGGNGPYVIPVAPTDAFSVKQALDPIFDYYKADTFVDVDGIVVSSGASYEMIEAVDTAIENIKKKVLDSPEGKAVGYRIGRAIGSRLIDRPSIGGNRKRRGRRDNDMDLPTGGNPGSRRPTGSNFDPDRDGWVDEGTTRPRFVGVPTDTQKLQSGTPERPEKRSVADRLARGIDPERHGLPGEDATLLDPKESEKRKTFDQIARNWLDSGMGWMDKPRENGDTTNSPDFLRGRELGTNQARLSWTGARRSNVRRPNGFNENDKSSEEYLDWYASHANRMGAYLSGMRLSSGRDNNRRLSPEEMRGIEDAVINNLIDKKPDIDPDSDENNFLGRWLDANGFDGNLINADSADARMSFNSGARVPNGPREGDGFNLDSPFGDPDEPFDSPTGDSDNFVDRVVRDFLDQADIGSRQDDYMAERDEERRGGLASGSRRRQRNWEDAPMPEPPTDEELEAEYQDFRRRERLGEVFDLAQPITKEKETLKRHIARQRARTDLSRREREYYEILDAVADGQGINPSQRKILVDDFFKRSFPDDTLEAVPDFTTEEYDVVAREVLDADELDRHLAMEADRVNPPLSDEELEAQLDAQYQDYLKTPEGRIYLDGESARLDGENKLSSGYRSYANTPEQRRTPRQVAKYEGHVRAALSSGSRKKPDVDANGRGELVTKDSPRLKEIYDKFAEEVIAAIEKAIQDPSNPNWEIPWRTTTAPRNPTTGRPYTGVRYNLVLLNALKANRGYPTAKWAGKVQWENRNRLLRGDRKAQLEFDEARGVDILVPEVKDGVKTGNFYVQRIYNVADVKGLPEKEYLPDDPINPDQAVKEIDQIVNNEIKPVIKVGGDKAYYSPSQDFIGMPEFGSFKDAVRYYSTLFHETVHWTGHETRNDRPQKNFFGTPEYAYEELIAEIGASQALALVGLTLGPREDHVQYLKSWLKALKNDPDMLRRAVDEAQEAVDALLEKSPTMRRFFGIQEGEIRARRDAFRKRKVGVELPIGEGMEGSERIKDGGKKPKMPTTGPVSGYPTEFLSSGRRLTPGQRDSLRSHANGLDIDERNIYEPFGKSQRSRDGRVYDVTNKLSSGAKKGPIKSADGKRSVPRTPDDVSLRENFDLSYDPTDQQRDITDVVLANIFGITESGVTTISAGAGTGKTTTLKTVMKAIDRLFDFEHLANNPEARARKIDYLDNFFGDMIQQGIKDSKIKGKTKLSELDDKEFAAVIGKIRKLAKDKKAFYVVFGKKNEEDAEVEFGDNTAASTLSKLAWWGLRLGIGDEMFGRGMRDKVSLGMLKKRRHPTSASGKKIVIMKGAGGVEYTFEGFNPGWKDLGYKMVTDGKTVAAYLDLEKRSEDLAARRKAGESLSPGEDVFTVSINGQKFTLTHGQLGSVLFRALSNFLISGDDEPSAKHFLNTQVQDEQLQNKINTGQTVTFPDMSYPDISPEVVGLLQQMWKDMIDEKSALLPHQGAMEKIWALTRPSLKSNPGMIAHASKQQVTMPGDSPIRARALEQAKKLFGDKATIDDSMLAAALIGMVIDTGDIKTKGDPGQFNGYVVTGAKKSGAQWKLTVAKPYGADPNAPVDMFMIDEAQDMNEVVLRVLQDNKAEVPIILVGDPRQAIMAWRGSMDVLSAMDGDFQLGLTESFRYGPTIAHAANIILAQGNLDDEGLTGQRTFAHVVGKAEDVIAKLFNMEDLSPADFKKRLAHIENVFQQELARLAEANPQFGIVKGKDGIYKLTGLLDSLDKAGDKTRKPLSDALTAMRKDLTRLAHGRFIGPDEPVDAILTRTNAGIMNAAIAFAAARGAGGKPTAVVIPATRWKEMTDFLRHMMYVQAADKSKWTKPEPSPLIGDIWSVDEIKAKANESQHGPLRALLRLISTPPAGRKDPLYASEWYAMFKETRDDVQDPRAPFPVQFVKARKELGLSDRVEHPTGKDTLLGGEDLIAFGARTGKGTGAGGADASNSREAAYDIIPDAKSTQQDRVKYQLDFDQNDRWTGRVHITGKGAVAKSESTDGSGTTAKTAGNGVYYDDLRAITERLIESGVIDASEVKYQTKVARAKGSQQDPSKAGDAWVIEGNGATPEEKAERTAFILNRIGALLRQGASGQNGDIEIMTATTAKGKEWDRVRLWSDFKSPQKPFNWAKATPDEQEAQVMRTLDGLVPPGGRVKRKAIKSIFGLSDGDINKYKNDQQGLRDFLRPMVIQRLKDNPQTTTSSEYREELNIAYVAVTRAKRALDPGPAISELYLADSEERQRYEKAIADGIDSGEILDGARKPKDWVEPGGQQVWIDEDDDTPIVDIPTGDNASDPDTTPKEKPKKVGRPPTKKVAEEGDEEDIDGPDGGFVADDASDEPIPGDDDDMDKFDDDGNVLSSGARPTTQARREPAPVAPRQSAAPGRTRTSQPQRTLASGAMARRRERGAGMPEPTSRLGGREGRRINRLSSGATGIRATDLAAFSPKVFNDEEKLSVARRFWRRFRETGLALDTGGAESGAERKQKIRRGMDAVGERMAKSNVVKVGNVADNDPQNATSATWMLPVDKLLETIRIPTSFDTERDEANAPLNVTPAQTRSITPDELGAMLGMSPQESRALGQPGAGISSDTVRLLIAEIGTRPEFGAWRLFGRAEVESRTPRGQMLAFADNYSRSQLRDRFMIEAFGEDAFPFWYDKEEGEFIDADEYRDLGEISERGKFIAVGSFGNERREDGRPLIQSDTSGIEADIWADIDGTTRAIELDTPREASRARVRGSELRSSYSLDSLLDHLGIPRDSNWPDELRRRMQQSFGTEEVGLKNTNPTERRDWQSRGVPTGVVREMIRTGLIPDSATVWGDDSLDSALLRTTNNVYEAFNKFIDANWPGDRPITSRLRNQLAGATIDVTLPRAAAKQNKTWSVRNPNESLMEDDRMQAMVDRLNEALGTNFTIDDMFSDEQLRAASDDLSRGVTSIGRKTES